MYYIINKLITVSILLLIIAPVVGAQADDSTNIKKLLTSTRIQDCQDYEMNAEMLIPKYYNEGKFDSISAIIQFINQRCPTDLFKSYQILRQIQTGEMPQDWCDSALVNEILNERYYWSPYIDIIKLINSIYRSDSVE